MAGVGGGLSRRAQLFDTALAGTLRAVPRGLPYAVAGAAGAVRSGLASGTIGHRPTDAPFRREALPAGRSAQGARDG